MTFNSDRNDLTQQYPQRPEPVKQSGVIYGEAIRGGNIPVSKTPSGIQSGFDILAKLLVDLDQLIEVLTTRLDPVRLPQTYAPQPYIPQPKESSINYPSGNAENSPIAAELRSAHAYVENITYRLHLIIETLDI